MKKILQTINIVNIQMHALYLIYFNKENNLIFKSSSCFIKIRELVKKLLLMNH